MNSELELLGKVAILVLFLLAVYIGALLLIEQWRDRQHALDHAFEKASRKNSI